jgi:signal transduction histidine kinase/CheY-like chemotaxis protein
MNKLHQILIYIFFALMLSYATANSYLTVRQVLYSSNRGWVAAVENSRTIVVWANSKGPASVLRAGDEVVALEGFQLSEVTQPASGLVMATAGYPYDITVRRDGTLQTFKLQTAPLATHWILSSLMGSVIVPAFFLLTALIIFLLRRNDRQVQLLAVMLGTFIFDGPYQALGLPVPVVWVLLIGGTVSTIGTATLLHFFLRFPKTSPALKRFPKLGYLLYAPFLGAVMPYALLNYYRWAFSPGELGSISSQHPILSASYNYALSAYLAAGLLTLFLSYRRASQLERRKVRVILAGFLLGAVPFMLWNLLPTIQRFAPINPTLVQWSLLFALTALLLLPISFSYAIVRHQVIPVSLIVRRSVRYLLVARGFVLIEVLLVILTLYLLLADRAEFIDRYGARTRLVVEVLATMTLVVLTREIHKRIKTVIDKRFFREPYDVQEILTDLGQAFVNEPDSEQLLRLVAMKIQETLHAENVTAWALEPATGEYVRAFSIVHNPVSAAVSVDEVNQTKLALPSDALTIRLLSESKQALQVDFANPQSWVHARLGADNESGKRSREYQALQSVGAMLMLPVALKDRIKYVISLGTRLNDLPYSKEDIQMLASIVWLTNFAVENLELFERERGNQEQLRQAQKMEAVGRLAGGIAHDFNNLLTVINGNNDLALRKLGDESAAHRNLDQIRKAGERARDLTRQLLAFSRKQVLQPKVLQLNSVVADIDKMLRQLIGEDVDLLTVLDPSLELVKADPGQLEQVLMNLVVNARDAMPKGGKLTIETGNVYLDKDYADTHNSVQSGSYVMLAVSDTGSGMDSRTREKIFEPFYTTKEVGKGTGLGLSTVYGIVKQSGGNIWVYSEPGKGTTFKIYFPVVEQKIEVAAHSSKPIALPGGSETILLVEDEVLVRNMAREVLQLSGYNVLEASHGKEALKITQEFDKPIHLVVTDVVMPQMSGPELAGLLEKSSPLLKVLYMSGYTDEAIVHHGVLDEGVAFLEKPFTPGAFARKVREVLNS